MLKIFISCDNCGIREDSDKDTLTYEWLTVSDNDKENHFCGKKCLILNLQEETK